MLDEIVDFCFRMYASRTLFVSKYGARWVSKPSANSLAFDKDSVKIAIEYLMNNCFFTCGDCVYRQVICIPMGSEPAPFMVICFYTIMKINGYKILRKRT